MVTTVTELFAVVLLSLSPQDVFFSEDCLARGRTVTELPNPFLWYEGGLWLGCARRVVQGVPGGALSVWLHASSLRLIVSMLDRGDRATG